MDRLALPAAENSRKFASVRHRGNRREKRQSNQAILRARGCI